MDGSWLLWHLTTWRVQILTFHNQVLDSLSGLMNYLNYPIRTKLCPRGASTAYYWIPHPSLRGNLLGVGYVIKIAHRGGWIFRCLEQKNYTSRSFWKGAELGPHNASIENISLYRNLRYSFEWEGSNGKWAALVYPGRYWTFIKRISCRNLLRKASLHSKKTK